MNNKKVVVWDTYVTRKNGNVIHFEIIVDSERQDTEKSFNMAKTIVPHKGARRDHGYGSLSILLCRESDSRSK
ncbi:MAG: DUF2024 family protein [Cyclobacteriaceae bacterium]